MNRFPIDAMFFVCIVILLLPFADVARSVPEAWADYDCSSAKQGCIMTHFDDISTRTCANTEGLAMIRSGKFSEDLAMAIPLIHNGQYRVFSGTDVIRAASTGWLCPVNMIASCGVIG